MKYFLYKLSTLKVQIVLMCLFAAASYPLFCAAQADWAASYEKYTQAMDAGLSYKSPEVQLINAELADKNATMLFVMIIGIVALIAMFTMGMAILLKCYGYLHRKDRADTDMTAPVTVRTRFFGSFFAGLAVYLVPHMIGAVSGSIILGGVTGTPTLDNMTDTIRMAMQHGLMMCLLFYCSTAVIVAVCGRMRTVISNTLLLNFAVPAITVCAGILSFNYGYGLHSGLFSEIFGKVGWLTPLGLLIKFGVQGIFGIRADARVTSPQFIPFLIYCAAFVAAAYLLVKHRRHERTGRTYTFRYARHIIAGIVVLAVTLVISANILPNMSDYVFYNVNGETVMFVTALDIILWILTSFGFFCACEFSGSKGEKGRGKRFALFLPYLLGSAAVTFLVTLTQGFGAAYRIPSVNETLSARMNVNVGSICLYCGDLDDDTADPSEIVSLHRDIITHESGGNGHVTIDYILKDGTSLSRGYDLSDEYLKRAFELAKVSPKAGDAQWYCVLDERVTVRAANTPASSRYEKQSQRFKLKELRDAFTEDMREMNFEKAKAARYDDNEMVKIKEEESELCEWVSVYPFYTHTLAVLEQYGLTGKDIFG